jgi:predicted transcriptional regulator
MTATNSAGQNENSSQVPDSEAIETVAFLARSEHRVHVVALLNESERTRDDLSEAVGVTRVTLSRILSDLEEKQLIARQFSDSTYVLTRYGELVYQDFNRLLGTVSVGQSFPDVVERLPTEFFDFDLRYLGESELVGDGSDPMAAARVVANAVGNASTRHALLGTFLSIPLYTFEEALQADDEPEGAVIFDSEMAETMLTDADLRSRWQKIESIAENPVYYRVDERIPCGVALIDHDTVFLTVDRDGDNGFDVVRSTHPAVIDWAEQTIEKRRTVAEPLRESLDERA